MKARTELTIFFVASSLALGACGSPPEPAGGTHQETAALEEEEREESRAGSVQAWEAGPQTGAGADAGIKAGTGESETAGGEPSSEPASEPETEKLLTVDRILELSGREDLTWEDFQDYPSEDIGSGLHILKYDIDDDFCLLVGGGGMDQEPMYIRAVSARDQEDYIDIRNPVQEVRAFFQEHRHAEEYVGIRGHVKEVGEDQVLISSDTDDFPGVFWVEGAKSLTAEGELKGGTPVFVLMEDTGTQAHDGLELFRAKQIMALSESVEGKADILLTSPPSLSLTDVLSSKYQSFEIQPRDYSWSTMEGGEAVTVVACGAAPLEFPERADRLKIPPYNGVDQVCYALSTAAAPDKLVVCRWDKDDAGEEDRALECMITYYCPVFTIDLEKDKVYELTAEWKEDNLEEDGYAGRAGYVLVTE